MKINNLKLISLIFLLFAFFLNGCVYSSLAFEEKNSALTEYKNPYPFKFYINSILFESDEIKGSLGSHYYTHNIKSNNEDLIQGEIKTKLLYHFPNFFTLNKNEACPIDFKVVLKEQNISNSAMKNISGLFMLFSFGFFSGIECHENLLSLILTIPDSNIQIPFVINGQKVVGIYTAFLIPPISNNCWKGNNKNLIAYYKCTGAFKAAPPEFLNLFPKVILSAEKKQIIDYYILQQGGIKLQDEP